MKLTTAGESHGKALIAVIEGLPAHLEIDTEKINAELALRQSVSAAAEDKRSKPTASRSSPGCAIGKRSAVLSPFAFTIAIMKIGARICRTARATFPRAPSPRSVPVTRTSRA